MMDSRSLFLICLVAALMLAANASAWGTYTQKHMCEKVVKSLWGVDVLESCITNMSMESQQQFCNSLVEYRDKCLEQSVVMHPSEVPDVLFNEPEVPMEQDVCPIRNGKEQKYLCENETTATNRADEWFNLAEYSPTECWRIYMFCIGAAYQAEAYNPYNWVRNENPECNKILEKQADEGIRSGALWRVSQVCEFDYMHELAGRATPVRYRQPFGASSETVDAIISNLTTEALELKGKPLYVPTTTSTTTTIATTTTVPKPRPTTTTHTTTTTTLPEEPAAGEEESDTTWMLMLAAAAIVAFVAAAYYIRVREGGGRGEELKASRLGGMAARRHLADGDYESSLATPGVKKKKPPAVKEEKPPEKPAPEEKKDAGGKPRIRSFILTKREGSKLGDAGSGKD